jgi:hypothetical protein
MLDARHGSLRLVCAARWRVSRQATGQQGLLQTRYQPFTETQP